MASLKSSAVEVLRSQYLGFDKNRCEKIVKLSLTGQGTEENSIDASIFGFKTFCSPSSLVSASGQIKQGTSSFDGTKLLIAGDDTYPVDISGEWRASINGLT